MKFTKKIIWEYLVVILFLFLISVIYLNTHPTSDLYTGFPQNMYYPYGLRIAGQEFLTNDWYSNTKPLHIAFSHLIAVFEKLGILVLGTKILDFGFRIVLLLSIWLLIFGLWNKLEGNDKNQSILQKTQFPLVVFLFFVLTAWPVFPIFRVLEQHGFENIIDLWQPVGTMASFHNSTLLTFNVVPSNFGIFILLGLSLFLFEKWRLGSFFLGIASLFHINFGFQAGIIVLILIFYLYFTKEKQIAWHVFIIFSLVSGLNFFYFLFEVYDPLYGIEGNKILLQYTPFMLGYKNPQMWWGGRDTVDIILILIGGSIYLIKYKTAIRWILIAKIIILVSSLLLLIWTGNETLAMFMPYRSGVYLYFIGFLGTFTTLLYIGIKLLDKINIKLKYVITTISIFLAFWGVYEYGLTSPNLDLHVYQEDDSLYPYYELLNKNTAPEDVILIPYSWIGIRLGAERSVFVDMLPPIRGIDIIEYQNRREFLDEFYSADGRQRQIKCQEVDVDYYLVETTKVDESEILIDSVLDYSLIKCPSTNKN